MLSYQKSNNMASKHNLQWSEEDKKKLEEYLEKGMSTAQAASLLGRTVPSVWCRKHTLKTSGELKSTRRFAHSDYGKKHKKRGPKPSDSTTNEQRLTAFMESMMTALKSSGLRAEVSIRNHSIKSIIIS